MYDKDKLKKELTLDEIKTILIELGAQHIETHLDKGHIITNTICHNISDGKMKLYYYIDEMSFHCYTACGTSFDIFDLVINNHILKGIELSFGDSIRWILNILGKSNRIVKPNGFGHDSLYVNRREELDWLDSLETVKPVTVPMKAHSDYIFNLFSKKPHPAFLNDGISEDVMRKFEIMYYEKTNRITIPHRHHDTGEIIGIKTRSLSFEDIDKGFKYVPLMLHGNDVSYSYPTFQSLYGYYQNKENIKRIGRVVVFESEKSVLKMETFFPGQNFSVALSGSNVSKHQVEMLLKSGLREVVLALDKEFIKLNSKEAEIYKEKVERLCRMFSSYVKVSMIWDRHGLLDYKDSPADKGIETFKKLFKNRKIISTIS